MSPTPTFPQISSSTFDGACRELSESFARNRDSQREWLSAEMLTGPDARYLRVTKELKVVDASTEDLPAEAEDDEVTEDDEEARCYDASIKPVTIEYDIILSPSYQVPVLYFSIKDPHFRFPPTLENLHRYIVPPQFKSQVESVGVIGGVTVTDHPFTNAPVFFIHPCRTVEVLHASSRAKTISSRQYLHLWMGAMGGCVGLSLPMVLAQDGVSTAL